MNEGSYFARRAIIVGASGGIGKALAKALRKRGCEVVPLSRNGEGEDLKLDIDDEASIEGAAKALRSQAPFDLIIVATGLLHGCKVQPEKSYRELCAHALARYFAVNATGPALVARYFLPLLHQRRRAVFAVLSARVGSISDNRLGGWYGYRASKAALNMIVRCQAIELGRTRPQTICLALHPGSVETGLSEPFQKNIPAEKLFSPARAAECLLEIIGSATTKENGKIIAWDGSVILP